jgi:putative transposase
VIGMARSSFYYKPVDRSAKIAADAKVVDQLRRLAKRWPQYGYRRMAAALKAGGTVVNHKRLLRLMRESELTVRPRRRYVRTTNSDHPFPIARNLYGTTAPTAVNQLWVSDITYIGIGDGRFVYLAVVLDAWSRKVVGYGLGRQIDTRLTLAALRAAVADRSPSPGCIHHSDRGAQYAAHDYRGELAKHGMICSMSRRGNPYDNPMAESFMKTLKVEEVYQTEYECFEDVAHAVPRFIEEIYNAERLHSALGYCSPTNYELRQAA